MSNGKKENMTCAFHGDLEGRIGVNSNAIKRNNDMIHKLGEKMARATVFGSLQLLGLAAIIIRLFFM